MMTVGNKQIESSRYLKGRLYVMKWTHHRRDGFQEGLTMRKEHWKDKAANDKIKSKS